MDKTGFQSLLVNLSLLPIADSMLIQIQTHLRLYDVINDDELEILMSLTLLSEKKLVNKTIPFAADLNFTREIFVLGTVPTYFGFQNTR